MFANTYQTGFLSVFYSVGSNPLSIWDKQVKNGHIRRIVDDEVKSLVLELSGTNVATTYITTPIKPRASLGIRLPFLVLIIKNMKKYFTFEIQILDDKDMHRRFRVSNFQSTTKVRPFCTTMPIGLSAGWNQIQFNLADFTRRAYGTVYVETMRVQIHANARIRRIYFSDRLYSENEMPNEYKLFMPRGKAAAEKQAASIETAEKPHTIEAPSTTQAVAPSQSAELAAKQSAELAAKESAEKIGSKKSNKSVEKHPTYEEIPSGAPPTPEAGSPRELIEGDGDLSPVDEYTTEYGDIEEVPFAEDGEVTEGAQMDTLDGADQTVADDTGNADMTTEPTVTATSEIPVTDEPPTFEEDITNDAQLGA